MHWGDGRERGRGGKKTEMIDLFIMIYRIIEIETIKTFEVS